MWKISVQSPNEGFREIPLKPGINPIGRIPTNYINILDVSASRQHAELRFDESSNELKIKDLNSTNGTFVNGKRIEDAFILEHEDQVRIGSHLITVIHIITQSLTQKKTGPLAEKKISKELLIESVDHYAVLLHEIGKQLNYIPDMQSALDDVAALIMRMIGADKCSILPIEDFNQDEENILTGSLTHKVMDAKSATIISDLDSIPIGNGDPSKATIKSILIVPVLIEDEVVAIINATRKKITAVPFNDRDLRLVIAVAHQVALAIQRKRIEAELVHNASHDPLTGLPNRNMFVEHLNTLIDQQKNNSSSPSYSVLFIDIDNFKLVNDSLGHVVGDKLLLAISAHFQELFITSEFRAFFRIMARFGGDEFAVLFSGHSDFDHISVLADLLLESLATPFHIENHDVFATASIGITHSSMSYILPDHVLRDADIAMYQAKESGKARYKVYDDEMRRKLVNKMRMASGLRKALTHDELLLHFQPIISMSSGSIVGFEGLLRWNSPEIGLVYPEQIFNSSDTTGLLNAIDFWAMEHACKQLSKWHKQFPNFPDLFVSVNLSSKQIRNPNLMDHIQNIVSTSKINPDHLWLEITESASIKNSEATLDMLTSLRSQNIHLSLDDFGTGFSSLSYLPRFPIDSLKIDQSFIHGIGDNKEENKILETIMHLASTLGLAVVAEGVETAEQFEFLKERGCQMAQGYFFAEPIPAEQINSLLIDNPIW
ncbi:MAG: EAL domain-containing protein [Anaerolineae bacterium]|nr:EAL domain-containing protein [Anaerolineae bacterium]